MDDAPIITMRWPLMEAHMRNIEYKLRSDKNGEAYRTGRLELERFVDETMREVQTVKDELAETFYSVRYDHPEKAVRTIQRMVFIARMMKYDPSPEVQKESEDVKNRQLHYLQQVYALMRQSIVNYGNIEFYKRWEPPSH